MQTDSPSISFGLVLSGLRDLGYRDGLLRENYAFPDWFAAQTEMRVAAAAFGSFPASTETACIGVVHANGERGQPLINKCRSLGAPIVLEIDGPIVREWAVSPKQNGHGLIESHDAKKLPEVFASRAPSWRPNDLLRAKNIGSYDYCPQLRLFAGLIPELEEHIQQVLGPLLRGALSAASRVYEESSGNTADPKILFRVVFWVLTAKLFHDRGVSPFSKLSKNPDPDDLLEKVAAHYKHTIRLPLNKAARQAAVERLWTTIDFRNISVEVLAHFWSTTLLDQGTKDELAIHRTSRTIVRYIVDRIPFDEAAIENIAQRLTGESGEGNAITVRRARRLNALFRDVVLVSYGKLSHP